MAIDNFCFYLQNRLIQTSQSGGQWYNDTSPFRILCISTQFLPPDGHLDSKYVLQDLTSEKITKLLITQEPLKLDKNLARIWNPWYF
jgi:hypothetical protein